MTIKTDDLLSRIAQEGLAQVVDSLSDTEAIALADRYGAHNYHPLPVNVVRGEGARVWDGSGREFLDCIGAYSAAAHGHLNQRVMDATKAQLDRLTLTSRAVHCAEIGLFSQALAEYAGLDRVCPMNSGAEAVETCLKIARKWAYMVKGVPEDQAEVVVCTDNFHGRTIAIVGFSTEQGYKDGFGPFAPGFKVVPFGDLQALEEAITPNTAAFLAEPIQAEGGIVIPPDGYLEGVRELCEQNRTLLIWDEVQTGFCRTGERFAWQHEDAKPDLMAVGKPLGGGLFPVSAAVGKDEPMSVLKPGDHGSTFGGNPLACAIGIAALIEMEEEDYAGRSARLGARLVEGLRAHDLPHVVDVRGRGLLVGLEVDESIDTTELTRAFLRHGILTKETRQRTFRFTPPICIDEGQIDRAVEATRLALRETSAR